MICAKIAILLHTFVNIYENILVRLGPRGLDIDKSYSQTTVVLDYIRKN